jgi:hypothetical protein
MVISMIALLLPSPPLLVELSIDRNVYPKHARTWDRIGLFRLKDGDNHRLVLLYYYDSDSELGFTMVPNDFAIDAIYQDASGKWAHKRLLSAARLCFTRIAKIAPDHVVLECGPSFAILGSSEKPLRTSNERENRYKKRVSFIGGVLTLR